MEFRICACCGQSFTPDPRVKNQTYCSSPACQAERRKRWRQSRSRTDEVYPTTDPTHHGVGRLNHIGGSQAASQFTFDAELGNGEHLIESFKHTGSGIRVLGLETPGQFLQTQLARCCIKFERLLHQPAHLLGSVLGKALRYVANLMDSASLHFGVLAAQLLDSRAQRLGAIDHPQACNVEVQATPGQSCQQVLNHLGVLAAARSQSQNMLAALRIHAHCGNDVVFADDAIIDRVLGEEDKELGKDALFGW